MPSIYLTTGQLVYKGPDGQSYDSNAAANADADDRNQRAAKLGLKARYTTSPDAKK